MPAAVAGSASRTAASRSPSGRNGVTTGPYHTSVSGYPRPELLATVDWLAENLGRPEVRVLDVRSRPDGTGRAAHAAGHIPGAGYLDWTTDLVDPDEENPLFLLAGPDQVAAALGRLGVGGGTTVVLYDDTASLYAARAWWSLRVYGLESCRILNGGLAAWTAAGHELSRASLPPAPGHVHPAGGPSDAAHDVRRPGSPRVPRRAPDRRPGAGRVPRVRGQHPPARDTSPER